MSPHKEKAGRTVAEEQKRAIHAYLSTDGHDKWHNYAEEEGVSVSGLLEALATHLTDDTVFKMPDVIKEARRIDAQRRRRHGGSR